MKHFNLTSIVLALVVGFQSYAQPVGSGVLDEYIKTGLSSNEAVKQQNFSLEKSMYALKEANGLFLPTVNLLGTYTLAKGGRTINLPLGDLFNPTYGTLNQLTQSNRFPTDLQNQEVQFNPNNFYDAKFRVAMPLFNTDLIYNRKIKQATIGIQEAQVTVYKRELVKDIQVAYFNYLKASQSVDIYTNALALVQENKRINQRLVSNGSASPSIISRSNAEIAKIESGISESQTNQKNAAAYFNFLINKPLDSPIQVDSSLYSMPVQPLLTESSTAQREEKLQYKNALEANKYVNLLSTSNYLPKLNAFIDLGSQAFDFKFNYQSRYYMAGLSLDWPIFSGFRNTYKSKQTALDLAIVQSQAADVDKKLELQLQTSTQSYISAKELYLNNLPQVDAAKKYLDDVIKRYKEGQAIFIEVLDARTEYTNAQLQLSVALFNVYSKKAELDRASASYQF